MIASTRARLTYRPIAKRPTNESAVTRHLTHFLVVLVATTAFGCAKVSMTAGPGSGSGGSTGMVTIKGLTGLSISPSSAEINLMQMAGQIVPGTASFTAQGSFDDGSSSDVTGKVAWSLTPALGGVTAGNATINGPGIFSVTAYNGPITATAQLTANFSGNFVGGNFDTNNAAKLDGAATANAVNIAYPLAGAVFPSNLGQITVHVSKSGSQDIARLSFTGDGLKEPGIRFYAPCDPGPGAGCYVNVPPDVTRFLVAPSTKTNISLTARLASTAGGGAFESNAISLAWSDVPLSGGLYYWTTISPGVVTGYHAPAMAMVGTGIERYNLDPTMGVAAPEAVPIYTDQGTAPNYYGSPPSPMDGAQCVGCHAITNDGKTMALTVGGAQDSDLILLDIATKTLTTFNPAAAGGSTSVTDINYYKQFSKPSIVTETAFGPNGDVMVNMYRSQLTLRTVDVSLTPLGNTTPPGPVVPSWSGLKTDPYWSYTGKYFVFASFPAPIPGRYNTEGTNGDIKTGAQIVIADATPTGVMDNARTLVPAKPGFTSFYPVVSTDDALVAYDQSACGSGVTDVNKMSTDYGSAPCDGYDDSTAELWVTTPAGQSPLRLANANGAPGSDNSWPRFSPNIGNFRGHQLYWLAFSSRRPYGLQVNVGVAPVLTKPQLWFAAVVKGAEFTVDPSYAAVWLPNQNPNQAVPSGNHVPQWVKIAVPIK